MLHNAAQLIYSGEKMGIPGPEKRYSIICSQRTDTQNEKNIVAGQEPWANNTRHHTRAVLCQLENLKTRLATSSSTSTSSELTAPFWDANEPGLVIAGMNRNTPSIAMDFTAIHRTEYG